MLVLSVYALTQTKQMYKTYRPRQEIRGTYRQISMSWKLWKSLVDQVVGVFHNSLAQQTQSKNSYNKFGQSFPLLRAYGAVPGSV